MKTFLSWIGRGTEEAPGVQSNVRQMNSIIVCTVAGILALIAIAWFIASMTAAPGVLAEVPGSVIGFIGAVGGILGAVIGAKVFQQKNE